jgi:hypothetical protein
MHFEEAAPLTYQENFATPLDTKLPVVMSKPDQQHARTSPGILDHSLSWPLLPSSQSSHATSLISR